MLLSLGIAAAQPVLLHTHEDMCEFHPVINSHVRDEHLSSIEDIFSSRGSIESVKLLDPKHVPSEQLAPAYPRIKHMRDGRWIMVYQGGQNSSRIYAIYSNDLKTWYGKQQLWGPEQVEIEGKSQYKRYSHADILQLKTGELVCLATFRCDFASEDGKGSGIVMKRSRDCGEHWAKPEEIYNQPCAQPDAIELPDGSIHCYFSDCQPKADSDTVAMIESFDGGYTWSTKKIIARQSKFHKDGHRMFPSGETLFSAMREGFISIKLGDVSAEKFQGRNEKAGWFSPIKEKGTWGSTEVSDPNRFIYVQDSPNALHYGVAWLNHSINALPQTITLDGDSEEWLRRDALFIGSDSDVQAVFRAAYDEENLYIAVDRKDAAVNTGSKVSLTLHNEAAKRLSAGNSVNIVINSEGMMSADTYSKTPVEGVKAMTRKAKTRNGDKGYVCEICIPLSSLGAGPGSTLRFNAVVEGNGLSDGFTNAQAKKPQTWQRIKLQ